MAAKDSGTHILVIEDEPKVAQFIKNGLDECGFSADIAADGIQGKTKALSGKYHLIVLDINLPHINGFQLCKIIRAERKDLPILMLTALSSLDDKIKGFDEGADDYLVKPFEFAELLARIKALVKRYYSKTETKPVIVIDDLEIDREGKRVFRNKKAIELTAKEFLLLEYLAIHEGKVVSRNELSENVWGINFDTGTNVVDVYINFLRKKIDSSFDKKLIHTRIGLGYVLSIQ
jgi:two-component system, OmpR family, copper resistance phosphate regulon response regulator CusR